MAPSKTAPTRHPAVDRCLRLVELPGTAGERYTAAEVARALGVDPSTVIGWIERGWLRAARGVKRGQPGYYRIKRSALRRLLRDYPQCMQLIADAYNRRQSHG